MRETEMKGKRRGKKKLERKERGKKRGEIETILHSAVLTDASLFSKHLAPK
jgi:hypothetical protein